MLSNAKCLTEGVAVPSGVEPAAALRDNKAYQVVWQVLQALRSHDEHLAAEINKIDINGTSRMVQVIGVGLAGGLGRAQVSTVVSANQGLAPGVRVA